MKLAAFLILAFAFSTLAIPVSVMLELDVINNNNQLSYPGTLKGQLQQLKNGGVDGVMTDMWWGLVEKNAKQYNFGGYSELVRMCDEIGLKVQFVMSFHRCGGNANDNCNIPLPDFVREVGSSNPDIYYRDSQMHSDEEYLSSGVDDQPLFGGRTAVDMYSDFMSAFKANFSSYLGNTITQIQVGLGPAGELRYPGYQLQYWTFPGIGEFQCYDKYLLARLEKAACAAGQCDWGLAGPNDAGTYNSRPWDANFFNQRTRWDGSYGEFFLGWYAANLAQHGDAVLSAAAKVFAHTGTGIAAKIAGIHWWYDNDSHAAEMTAGYYNFYGHDGYLSLAKIFSRHNTTFDFTCLEMRDREQSNCGCGPQELVRQTIDAAKKAGVHYAGENALPRFDTTAYDQILTQAAYAGSSTMEGFTYLRLGNDLLSSGNWNNFVQFVNKMHSI